MNKYLEVNSYNPKADMIARMGEVLGKAIEERIKAKRLAQQNKAIQEYLNAPKPVEIPNPANRAFGGSLDLQPTSTISTEPQLPSSMSPEQNLKLIEERRKLKQTTPTYVIDRATGQMVKVEGEEGENAPRIGYTGFAPPSGGGGRQLSKQVIGFDPETKRAVYKDMASGRLLYSDNDKAYMGGPLLPTSARIPSEDVATQLATFKTLESQAKELLDLSAEKGERLIGPVRGNYNKLKSKLFDNPEFVDLDSKIGRIIETAYALSGKQIAKTEMDMLKDEFWAQSTDPKANFETKFRGFVDWLVKKQKVRIDVLRSFGYYIPKDTGENFDVSGSTKKATHRYNPSTGQVEEIKQ